MTTPWVLVVDDDRDIRDVMVMILDLEGYRAVGASDGMDALDQIRTRGRPDVVLLDLRMPHMNGAELAAALRGDPQLAPAPIVILSGDTNAPEVADALGAQGMLKKPIELRELIATVRQFVPDGQRR
jgi:CheY-like chemotaxis protein